MDETIADFEERHRDNAWLSLLRKRCFQAAFIVSGRDLVRTGAFAAELYALALKEAFGQSRPL